jgi:hypothetical protein
LVERDNSLNTVWQAERRRVAASPIFNDLTEIL